MIENDFQKICLSVLNGLDNKAEYVELCKKYWDFENRKGLSKKEATEVKDELELDFKLAGTEKRYYKDYFFGSIQLRFMIPYGHGMVDCSYRVFSPMSDNSIPSFSYRRIVQNITGDFENYELTFPMNKNIEEFKVNLKFILKLNEKIIDIFDSEFSKLNNKN
ncbi:hypothetical protein [Crocinitomix catalasitica]|uniref:hypothetical protein n=1 Tax=Crocinitomix catalasitica TaxID=184607 RepID=UPI00048174CF|nr:hypothetical protein [Crocinitomix catalasitica]